LTHCRCSDAKIDTLLETQFGAGRLYAAISSRPGQVGRADGYILEGKELEVSFKFGCGRGFIEEALMMVYHAVLLEEIADREAEARLVIHGTSGPFQSWLCCSVVPWTPEKMVAHVWTPRGLCWYF
jgi:hypothetical protein